MTSYEHFYFSCPGWDNRLLEAVEEAAAWPSAVGAPYLTSGGHGFKSHSYHLAGVVSSTPRSCL